MAAVHPSPDAEYAEQFQLYRLIADAIPLMVWTARADGAVDFVNQRVVEYTGLGAEALRDWGWDRVIHPDDREQVAAVWTRALANGEPVENEMRLRRADGEYRRHHGSGVPMRDARGRVVSWLGICADIEAETRVRAMRETQARLRALTDNEPDECVKVLDAQGRLVEMNAAGLDMIEADRVEDVLGMCVYELVAPEHRAAFRELTERVCRGERGSLEFALIGLKGARRWMQTQAVPLRDEASGETRLLGITRDRTERRRAEQALRESEQRFQAFLNHLPASAWIRDSQFRYTYVNRLYAKTWGVGTQSLIGREAGGFFSPAVAERFRATDRAVQREGAPMQYVDSLPSGRWLKVKFPVPDGAGGVSVAGIAVDITEQSRLEEALRASEQRFRAFMEHVPAAAWVKDAQLRYSFVNRGYEEVFGRSAADTVGRDDFEVHDAAFARDLRAEDETIQRTGVPVQKVHEVPYADGRPGHWVVMKFPLADATGGPGVAGIAVDITERNRLEQALRESDQRFRSFMEHAPARAWIKDARLRYKYVNSAFARDHGRAEKDFIGRDDFELFPPDIAGYFREHDEAILRGKATTPELRQFPRENGTEHWLAAKFPIADGAGGTGVAGIAFDVTDRVEAEDKVQRYAQDVRDLVGRLVQAQETERRRVAGELHDLIGQNLTALGIDLQALKQRMQAAGDEIAAPRLDAMASLLDGTIDAIRGVMTELRPAALEEFGLVPALRWYASQFGRRTGMKVRTRVQGREVRLPKDAELAVFRIVQEALTNAAKHSGGTSVDIAIRHGKTLRLTVHDDGCGFAEAAEPRRTRGTFGLTTMRERAESFGGTLSVESPGQGTRVVVDMPAGGHGD
jgi:PAS domain S-box-containing protein